MADERYNRKNPAVKRILQEVKEMQANPSDDFMSLPLEENIFEWQFAIRGPSETEFEGGIYHGRIQLPSDYPFKPPSFLLLTPGVSDHAKSFGSKGSEPHKAAVIGETIGEPLKDTSRPSLNILIKLMVVESLIFALFFATHGGILFKYL